MAKLPHNFVLHIVGSDGRLHRVVRTFGSRNYREGRYAGCHAQWTGKSKHVRCVKFHLKYWEMA